VREVGSLDVVIFEYEIEVHEADSFDSVFTVHDRVQPLVDKIANLKIEYAHVSTQDPQPINLPLHKQNLRRAMKRLRRWLREHSRPSQELTPPQQEIVREALVGLEPEPVDAYEAITKAFETGDADVLLEYLRRKQETPSVLVTSLPPTVHSLLEEATEAYRHGVFRAVLALCRTLLEHVCRLAISAEDAKTNAVPLYDDNLETLINCLPAHLLKPGGRRWAH